MKIRIQGGHGADDVVCGEAELGMQPISEILAVNTFSEPAAAALKSKGMEPAG
jgi:hypothetical protein